MAVRRAAGRFGEGLVRRRSGRWTRLFRVGVVAALVALTAVVAYQGWLHGRLDERIAADTMRLDDVAVALARTRDEALTPGDLTALRDEFGTRLTTAAERLEALERRSDATARVIAGSVPSVVYLQGAYGFRDRSTGRMLRHAVDESGARLSTGRLPHLTLDGDGPLAERRFSGTGFAVGDGTVLVTSRHVALPWESGDGAGVMTDRGLEPEITRYIAWAPGIPEAGTVELIRASDQADLAILRLGGMPHPLPGLVLAAEPPVPGAEIVVMGYPTGLRSLLAQSGGAFVAELQEAGDADFWNVAERLARRELIVPLASRGIVGRATAATVVYDAETTLGGSGGPVIGADGAVVAVNTAILPEFGGSNLGVPAAGVRALMDAAAQF